MNGRVARKHRQDVTRILGGPAIQTMERQGEAIAQLARGVAEDLERMRNEYRSAESLLRSQLAFTHAQVELLQDRVAWLTLPWYLKLRRRRRDA
jgi:hypothetical protein